MKAARLTGWPPLITDDYGRLSGIFIVSTFCLLFLLSVYSVSSSAVINKQVHRIIQNQRHHVLILYSLAGARGTISFLQIFFGKLTNCQTTFCQPSFYPPFILPNFFCANLQFTKYILPNLHFLDFWKTYKFPSLCQIFILPNLHFAKPFSL